MGFSPGVSVFFVLILLALPLYGADAAARAPSLDKAAELRAEGDWDRAANAFREIWRNGPDSSRQEAALAYGRICLLKEAWSEAEAPLKASAESGGELEPYARLLLAESLYHQNREVDAALQLRRIEAMSPPRGLEIRLLRLSADVEHARKRFGREAEAWKRFLALKPSRAKARLARFRLAEAREAEGQAHKAFRAYEHIYYRETGSPYGHRAGMAMRRLAGAHEYALRSLSTSRALAFADKLLSGGRPEDALACLSDIDDRHVPRGLERSLALARLSCSYALRDNGAVLEQAGRMLERFGACPQTLDAMLKAAWTCIRTGDREGVLHWAGLVAGHAGRDQQSLAEAYVAMGTSAYAAGAFGEAAKYFEKLGGLRARRGTLASGLYRRAWCLYKMGEYGNARKEFLAAAGTYPERGFDAPCRYWAAVCEMDRSTGSDAVKEMTRLASDDQGYWSGKAADWLKESGHPCEPSKISLKGLGAWPENATTGPAALARRLAVCGLEADAAEAFGHYYRAHPHDRSAALTLALLDARAGRGSSAGAILKRVFGRGFEDPRGPRRILAAAYPTPYLGLVKELCKKEGVPVPLAMALVRRESGFDPGALSPVGARGFMQLMPATAKKMSIDLHLSVPEDDSLHDPLLNLTLGIHYLGRLMKDLPPAGAVAAYNAGDGLVWSWLTAFRPASQQQFVGMIPYTETRVYTAGVLRDAEAYEKLLARGPAESVRPSEPGGPPPS